MPTRKQLADALRVLAMDAIEQANSGHPGAPMGMADMAEALWRHGLKHNPQNPNWFNRDRFILSNGHASMLLYGLLHLSGYALSLDDLKDFRQLGSKTPGHPEYGLTPGVDMTTGPLGQGVASAVGLALAERLLAATFNRPGYKVVDHHTYCFLGDGCIMEGVTQEACSLAGTWGLGRLICYYDANGISIDGEIASWLTEDIEGRFKALGWQVIGPLDGHDPKALDDALACALSDEEHPSLIICQTHIGYASSKVDSAKSHGAPLGEDVVKEAKQNLGWDHPPFELPKDVVEAWDGREQGKALEAAWLETLDGYTKAYPELASEFKRRINGEYPVSLPEVFEKMYTSLNSLPKGEATRKSSQKCLEILTAALPELIGGSADLSGSVGTITSHSKPWAKETANVNYLYYGVREFGMGCIMNGLALHGGFVPYAGTFLSFSDQAKNAIRLGSLMGLRVIWVFTHDSIYVGEDGPTHQPVEQLPALRMIPKLRVWRPCDGLETACAWADAIKRKGSTCLILSRQSLPKYPRVETELAEQTAMIHRGGYILRDCSGEPHLIILATGSELELAVGCYEKLTKMGEQVRVVSLPCTDLFDAQDEAWKEMVLPNKVRNRLAIEAAAPVYLYKYVGLDGKVLGLTSFGVSAKAKDCAAHFGFTLENVLNSALDLLKKPKNCLGS